MKKFILIIILSLSFSSPSWGKGILCDYFGIKCKEIPSHRIIENGGMYFEIDSNTPFNGIAIEYTKGEIYIKKHYRDGLFYLRERYFDGKLRTSLEFKNNKPHGDWKLYHRYSNKNISELGFFENGKPLGTWIHYNEKGEIKRKLNFSDLGTAGVVGYYMSGKINQKGFLKMGEPHGSWEHFHENGRTSMKVTYIDGEPHGLTEIYYKNGQLHQQGNYN